MGSGTDEIIEKLFYCLLQRYQEGLEKSMKGSEFSLNRGGWNIDTSKWLKNKKATINSKNNDNKCFQYAVTMALNIKIIKTIQKE